MDVISTIRVKLNAGTHSVGQIASFGYVDVAAEVAHEVASIVTHTLPRVNGITFRAGESVSGHIADEYRQ